MGPNHVHVHLKHIIMSRQHVEGHGEQYHSVHAMWHGHEPFRINHRLCVHVLRGILEQRQEQCRTLHSVPHE